MTWTYGPHLRDEWLLDPTIRYLNHGTVGAPPRRVLEEQRRIQADIERQPAQFLIRDLAPVALTTGKRAVPHMREAASRVGAFLGARGKDVVFADNATSGIYAVMSSWPMEPGDGLLVADTGYGGVNNGAAYLARQRGLTLQTFVLPTDDPRPERITEAFVAGLQPHTRLAVVDQIHSSTGLILPIADIAQICRERDVRLIVDAAHVPGAVSVDIEAIGADFWVGNLHKWGWAPRSSAVLWARPEHQDHLHPPVISWGLDQGFAAEFDLVGTRDPSPHLTAPFALDLLEAAGGQRVIDHNRALALRGATHIADVLDAQLMGVPSQWGPMVPVLLPSELAPDATACARIKDRLLFEDRIEAQLTPTPQGICLRVAAQIYNEMGDYEALAAALRP